MKRLSIFIPVISLLILLSGCMGALHTAVVHGDIKKVTELLDKGANVNTYGDVGTPLSMAASGGNIDIARLLIDRGAKYGGPFCNAGHTD